MEKVSVQRFSDIFNVLFLTYFSPRYIANIKKYICWVILYKKTFQTLIQLLLYFEKYIDLWDKIYIKNVWRSPQNQVRLMGTY